MERSKKAFFEDLAQLCGEYGIRPVAFDFEVFYAGLTFDTENWEPQQEDVSADPAEQLIQRRFGGMVSGD